MTTERNNLDYIETGFTATVVAADAVPARKREYLWIENQSSSPSIDIYVRCDGTAATADNNSKLIPAGGFWEPVTPPSGAVSIIAASGTPVVHIKEG